MSIHDFTNIGTLRLAEVFMIDFFLVFLLFFYYKKKSDYCFLRAKHFNYNIVNYFHLTKTRDLSFPYVLSFEILNVLPYELNIIYK